MVAGCRLRNAWHHRGGARPPSMFNSVTVMYGAASEAGSAANAETSSGSPHRQLAYQRHCFAGDTLVAMNAADFSTAVSASGTKSAWNTCHMPS